MQSGLAKQSCLLLGSRGVDGEVIVGIILARRLRGVELATHGVASDALDA